MSIDVKALFTKLGGSTRNLHGGELGNHNSVRLRVTLRCEGRPDFTWHRQYDIKRTDWNGEPEMSNGKKALSLRGRLTMEEFRRSAEIDFYHDEDGKLTVYISEPTGEESYVSFCSSDDYVETLCNCRTDKTFIVKSVEIVRE